MIWSAIGNFISGPLDCLLNLNARNLVIRFHDDFDPGFALPPTLNRAIATDKTELVDLVIVTSDFNALTGLENLPRERLRALVIYALDRCPNLKDVYIGYAVM